MRRRISSVYLALNDGDGDSGMRWWQRFPAPIGAAGLRLWNMLPAPVQTRLIPLGGLFGPHEMHAPMMPGPDSVPGVAALLVDGFEPIERYTGEVSVAESWPPEHRRSVAETRPLQLEDDPEAVLWLVRTPWAGIDLDDVFVVLWWWVERESGMQGPYEHLVEQALGWDEHEAACRLAEASQTQ